MRTLFAVALLSAGVAGAQVNDYREIKAPPLHPMQVPQPKRVQLGNGMVLFLMEDHELPLIRASADIRGGARDVPAGKTGLAGIYGSVWRTGGTKSKTGDELDDFLEARAARVETGVDEDSTSISLDVLKGDFDTVFPIFLDLLRNPEFRQDKIDLAKTQANTSIARRNDDPMALGNREANKLVYGADSPYARQPEYATIAAVTTFLATNEKPADVPKRDLLPAYRAFARGEIDKSLAILTSMIDSRPSAEALLLRGCAKYTAAMLAPKPDLASASNDFKAALRLNRALRLDRQAFSPKMVAFFEQQRNAR